MPEICGLPESSLKQRTEKKSLSPNQFSQAQEF